ncbi:MAG: zinc finger Ran-binding domain-containing protein [Armatimonadota bacterium]|nr:zinc finger Ran-binding domain-containing protein [Armatimonadota bacterium]
MLTNQKKCPKCGEDNPAEAVMCWACYTPLTGAAAAAPAVAAGGPGLKPPGAPGVAGVAGAPGAPGAPGLTVEEGEAKKAVQPWQLAIIGVVLLIVLGVGGMMMMGGGGGGGEAEPTENIGKPASPGKQPPSTGSGPAAAAPAIPAGPLPQPGGPGGNVTPKAFPYSMVAPPNSELDFATMGIVATEQDVSEREAKQLALFAGEQIKKVKGWRGMDIYVFNDTQAAQVFANYQNEKRGFPLDAAGYNDPNLTAVWPKVMARYYVRGTSARWLKPNVNPGGR